MKSEFVSVASNELRTPLATIKNAVQLILKGKTGEINLNKVASYLETIEGSSQRQVTIQAKIMEVILSDEY